MTPRTLELTERARRDLQRRRRYLTEVRGLAFARTNTGQLIAWLERLADGGAQLGTAVDDDPTGRSFGYRKQATILARFPPGRLIVVRIYFSGQDWREGR